jgi:acetoin utilization deacetylase AcuC-like enzyme
MFGLLAAARRGTMLPFKLVYHEGYDLDLGAHVFPSQKYRLIYEALLREKLAEPSDFLAPEPATDDDVLLVHTPEYVRKLRTGTLTLMERMRLEIPAEKEQVEAFWLGAGGTLLAARRAVADRVCASLGGGFHHAYPGHGEGFCMIHDVAIAIRRLQKDGALRTAMVVDTDVHQGNGTAAIFAHDDSVFTLSIHQENNYPLPKPRSKIDIGLDDGTGDADYLAILERHLIRAYDHFHPDLLLYVSGADPYREDQLGGLGLSMEGLERRDLLVMEHARRHGTPVAITLAGGYARRVEDTVRIHINTLLAARTLATR